MTPPLRNAGRIERGRSAPSTAMSTPDSQLSFQPQVQFPVVGLGASAGGLKALIAFLGGIPDDSGAAYVVVVHLSPEHESSVAQLLQAATKLPVTSVSQRTRIQPNH